MVDPLNEQARQFDRLPPHDLDAERAALAALMLCGDDEQTFEATRRYLRTESFYQADHGIYFDAILRIHARGGAVDSVMVRAELTRAGLYDECGGREYHAQILQSMPSAAHGPHYAAIVREKYVLREIIKTANSTLRRSWAPARSDRATEIAGEFLRDLTALACTGTADRIHRISDVLAEVLERHEKQVVPRIRTGLSDLDELIGGLPKGKFTLVGGRPGMGKSQLCKQIVLNVARRGVPCGIVTIEEDRIKIGQNYLANASGIANNKIQYHTAAREEWEQIYLAVPKLAVPIFIADAPVKLSEVEASVIAMVTEHNCGVVVVDYLQLIDPDNASENENREITRISKTLKSTFKRLGVAGVAACQLNRGNEYQGVRRPTLRDLRGSGSLEQDGDLILLLHREDYYHKGEPNYARTNQLEAIVAKNKDGESGVVPLLFDGATQSVSDWPESPAGNQIIQFDQDNP